MIRFHSLDDRKRRSNLRQFEGRLDRVELGGLLDCFAIGRHVQQAATLVYALDRLGRDDHRSAADPVARIHQEIADAPAFLSDQKVIDVTDLSVPRVKVVAGALLDAAKMARFGIDHLRASR